MCYFITIITSTAQFQNVSNNIKIFCNFFPRIFFQNIPMSIFFILSFSIHVSWINQINKELKFNSPKHTRSIKEIFDYKKVHSMAPWNDTSFYISQKAQNQNYYFDKKNYNNTLSHQQYSQKLKKLHQTIIFNDKNWQELNSMINDHCHTQTQMSQTSMVSCWNYLLVVGVA